MKTCTVSVLGADGLSHSVVVEGSSLYDAAGKGLSAINRDLWTRVQPGSNRKLQIYVHATGVTHWLPLHKVDQWLLRQVAPKDFAERQRVRKLIGK
mgnify:CR=1 FL=1